MPLLMNASSAQSLVPYCAFCRFSGLRRVAVAPCASLYDTPASTPHIEDLEDAIAFRYPLSFSLNLEYICLLFWQSSPRNAELFVLIPCTHPTFVRVLMTTPTLTIVIVHDYLHSMPNSQLRRALTARSASINRPSPTFSLFLHPSYLFKTCTNTLHFRHNNIHNASAQHERGI
jgi:hypothetical protein